jgi:hypothetical protein
LKGKGKAWDIGIVEKHGLFEVLIKKGRQNNILLIIKKGRQQPQYMQFHPLVIARKRKER